MARWLVPAALVLIVTPAAAFIFGWDRGQDIALIALVLLLVAVAVESIFNQGREQGRRDRQG